MRCNSTVTRRPEIKVLKQFLCELFTFSEFLKIHENPQITENDKEIDADRGRLALSRSVFAVELSVSGCF